MESTALEEASPPLESVPPWIEETIDSLGKQLLDCSGGQTQISTE